MANPASLVSNSNRSLPVLAKAEDEKRGYIYVSNADMGGSVSVFGFDPPTASPPFWQSFLPWLRR